MTTMYSETELVRSQTPPHNYFPKWWAGSIVFLAAVFPRVLDLGVFTAPDEQFIWRAANQFALALQDGNFAGTTTIVYPGVPVMWLETIAAWVRYGWLLLLRQPVAFTAVLGMDTPLALLGEKRLALGLVHILLVMLSWHYLDHLFPRPAALLAGVLLALDPFFLAETRVLRVEALNAEFIFLAVLLLMMYLQTGRQRYLPASGIASALAMLTKMSSLYLVFFTLGVLGVVSLWQHRPQWGQAVAATTKQFTRWAVAALVVYVGLWPAFLFAPAAALRFLWDYVLKVGETGATGSGVFFWGQVFPDDPGVWFYPVVLAFRIGPLVLPGIVLLAGFALINRKIYVPETHPSRRQSAIVWTLIAFIFSYIVFMTPIALKFDRYLLPVFPALDLLAALGIWQVWRWLAHTLIVRHPIVFALTPLLLALTIQIPTLIRVHPYYYPYYDPLLGGIDTAARYVRVGYTEGFDVLGRYLSAQPHADQLAVASAKSKDLRYFFPGKTIPLANTDGRWIQADYVFLYISQLQRHKHAPEIVSYLQRQNPVYRVVINGFTYGKLYPAPRAQYYSNSKLEGRAWLYGYNLSATRLAAGETLRTTVYFRNEGQLPTDQFLVRLVDVDGYVWAEAAVQPHPGFETAFQARKEIVTGDARLILPAGMTPGQYILQMMYFDTAAKQPIGYFELPDNGDDITVDLPETFSGEATLPDRATATEFWVDDNLSLVGYTLTGTDPARWLTLYWRATAAVQHDYVLGLQLLDETGAEATFWLGRPARSTLPTNEWQSGQVVQDPWPLTLPDDLPNGNYTLSLTVYDAATTEPVAATILQTVQVER